MARPQKHTVDYFPHDADASEGRTLSILFNSFGHEGISCWWQLLERVSKTNNHVISLRNGDDLEYLASKLHFSTDRLKAILDKLAELNAIDKPLLKLGYIWSQNFVDRLEQVYKTRRQDTPQKPVLIDGEIELIAEETPLILSENPQSKLKETKVKYIGEFNNVSLTKEEYNKLIDKYKEQQVMEMIEKLSGYMKSKNKRYSSHYATLLNWFRREEKEKPPAKQPGGTW